MLVIARALQVTVLRSIASSLPFLVQNSSAMQRGATPRHATPREAHPRFPLGPAEARDEALREIR